MMKKFVCLELSRLVKIKVFFLLLILYLLFFLFFTKQVFACVDGSYQNVGCSNCDGDCTYQYCVDSQWWDVDGTCNDDNPESGCQGKCGGSGGCTCTACTCVNPGIVGNLATIPSTGPIGLGTVISWTAPSSWGVDQGTTGCASGCSGCSVSNNKYYKILIDGVNRTSICKEGIGTVGQPNTYYLSNGICTIKDNPSDLIGQTKNLYIWSHNGCGSNNTYISKTFSSSLLSIP